MPLRANRSRLGIHEGGAARCARLEALKRERPDLLKPLELFGTSAGFRELGAGGADKMHALRSPRIEPAVRSAPSGCRTGSASWRSASALTTDDRVLCESATAQSN